jgi:hypothetical protein
MSRKFDELVDEALAAERELRALTPLRATWRTSENCASIWSSKHPEETL